MKRRRGKRAGSSLDVRHRLSTTALALSMVKRLMIGVRSTPPRTLTRTLYLVVCEPLALAVSTTTSSGADPASLLILHALPALLLSTLLLPRSERVNAIPLSLEVPTCLQTPTFSLV